MNTDVVVVTALVEERDALLAIVDQNEAQWDCGRDCDGYTYHRGKLERSDGSTLSIVVGCACEAGEAAAARCLERLRRQFKPAMIAMCGICGGDPDRLRLGDVIFASRVVRYDAGKRLDSSRFEPDGESIAIPAPFRGDIEEFIDNARDDWTELQQSRPVSIEFQARWLLRALARSDRDGVPLASTLRERQALCPDWPLAVDRLIKTARATLCEDKIVLTENGLNAGYLDLLMHPEEIAEPPFEARIGVVGTGSSVVAVSGIFECLRQQCRRIVALDQEAYAVAATASSAGIPWMIAKAVSDYADSSKDDRFHRFAARASADLLLQYLVERCPCAEIDSTENAPSEDRFSHDDVESVVEAAVAGMIHSVQSLATGDYDDRDANRALELLNESLRAGTLVGDVATYREIRDRAHTRVRPEWKPLIRAFCSAFKSRKFDAQVVKAIIDAVPSRYQPFIYRYVEIYCGGFNPQLLAQMIRRPDGDPTVVVAMALVGSPVANTADLRAAVLDRLRITNDADVRRVAIRVLAKHGIDDPGVQETLLHYLTESAGDTRHQVLSALTPHIDRYSELRSFLLLRARNDPALTEVLTTTIASAIPTSDFAYAFLVNCVGLGKDRLARSAIIALGAQMQKRSGIRAQLETWALAGATSAIRSAAEYVLEHYDHRD